jgi:hypothetical protein
MGRDGHVKALAKAAKTKGEQLQKVGCKAEARGEKVVAPPPFIPISASDLRSSAALHPSFFL